MSASLGTALDGVRVVGLVTNIPGPLAAARLRALGATVRKVEPLAGDPLAMAAPAWYACLVQNIAVERVALRETAARERLLAWLHDADVLLTAMRASALARLGLDWASLHARYPRLIHVAIVGEGAPHADRAGHDLTYQARAGLLRPPHLPVTPIADLGAAERTVSTVLAALLQRTRTQSGIFAEVAIVDAARAAAAPLRHGLTQPRGELGGHLPTYALYRARDGWVAFAPLEAHFAERAAALLGVAQLDEPTLRTAFLQRDASEWERLAEAHDIPLAAVVGSEVAV